jgi:xanthine/uracil permease
MRKINHLDTPIGSMQWFVFLLANSLTLPIVIGQVFGLSAVEIAGLMQRTFLIVGLSSLLSGWIGHRLPIPDGPAGIWLGVFVIMGETAASQGIASSETLRLLEGGMLVTGITMIVIGAAGLMNRMLKVFTPLITGVYLLLLAFQLSGVFLKGMISIERNGMEAAVNGPATAIAFLVFALVLGFSIWGRGWLKSYAVLIGITLGWIGFAWTQGPAAHEPSTPMPLLSMPELFAWGLPRLDAGMAVSSIIVAFVLITNIIASIAAMQHVLGHLTQESNDKNKLNRAGLLGGISNALSSLFSTVGVVPLSVAAGFVQMTGQRRRLTFFIACIGLMLMSFVPAIYFLFSQLPAPVAYAALLASFAQMVAIGLSSILREAVDQRRLMIVGVSLSIGTGVMFLPKETFTALPSVIQYICSNGLLMGMLVSLLLEHLWRTKPITASDGGK